MLAVFRKLLKCAEMSPYGFNLSVEIYLDAFQGRPLAFAGHVASCVGKCCIPNAGGFDLTRGYTLPSGFWGANYVRASYCRRLGHATHCGVLGDRADDHY